MEKDSIRTPISLEQRLAITLNFLASGTPYRRLAFSYRISHNTMSNVVRETCCAVYEELVGTYVKQPSSPEEWKEVAEGFYRRWNLPNTLGTSVYCVPTQIIRIVGAIDGKHVQIKKPPQSGSKYYNYKGHFSIVLMAVCDYKYRILYADFGNYGSDGDGRIFARCDFRKALSNGTLNLPADEDLPNSNRTLPHFFVADAAFPLSRHLMKPLSGKDLSLEERIYNYRCCRRVP